MEYVVLAIFCGLSAGVVAKIKGGSFCIWFLVGLCLPLIGTLAALLHALGPRRAAAAVPRVRERRAAHDQVCMRCGRDLEFP